MRSESEVPFSDDPFSIPVAERVRRLPPYMFGTINKLKYEKRVAGHDVIDLAQKFQDYGIEAVIYTDIGRDGMMTGVNIDATVELARSLTVPVIASGGINSLKDIESLCGIEDEGVSGAITGRAIYEGTIDFAAAAKLAQQSDQASGDSPPSA